MRKLCICCSLDFWSPAFRIFVDAMGTLCEELEFGIGYKRKCSEEPTSRKKAKSVMSVRTGIFNLTRQLVEHFLSNTSSC